jgi:hypothetical protein
MRENSGQEETSESTGGFGTSTRRTFLSRLGMTGLLALAGPAFV